MKFEKEDMVDEDTPETTQIEAESIEALMAQEVINFGNDDRLSPCYGIEGILTPKYDDKGGYINWAPGDGCEYTIAEYKVL